MIDGNNSAPINTGDTFYQTIIQRAARRGANADDLRNAYLAWLITRANALPLFAGDSGAQVQLSSVYTGMLTKGQEATQLAARQAAQARHAPTEREREAVSALEALNKEQYLVLMGGPGSGKTTFLNFVALCLAGESLNDKGANLKLLCAPIPPDPDKPDDKPKPQRWTHKALLPVRVVLRDFAADLPPGNVSVNADTLWNFIVKDLPRQIKRYEGALQKELLGKGGLILLDGLDEVPDALNRREQVKQAVQAFAGMYRKCRFLVTSRTYAYQRQDWKLNGFSERELLPFTRGQIERFIDTWSRHMVQLFRLTQSDADARAEILKQATQRPELVELAARPLLLTLMARLQTKSGGSLPENREELYAQSVNMLLDEWEGLKLRHDPSGKPVVTEPSLTEWLNASRENIRRELDKLAYQAHLNQPTLVGTADLRQEDLIKALTAASRNPDAKLMRQEEYLRDRAGLLTSHAEGLYQFPHRSFQEYLAACHLARVDFPDNLSRLAKNDPNRWREVTLLAAARSKNTPSSIWELVEELCAKDEAPNTDAPEPSSDAQWGALLAALVLAETGLAAYDASLQERHERKRKRVRDWQLRLLNSNVLPARERVLAGRLLAGLGDTREHLLHVDNMRFSAVPAGDFWMGETDNANAELHCNESLDYDYWIAATPVTVAQFRQFIAASQYQQYDPDSLKAAANEPVTSTSWHDALAFCNWLTQCWKDTLPAGWRVMLPSEAEWEKAARGAVRIPATIQSANVRDGFAIKPAQLKVNPWPQRAFPWGDDFDAAKANVDFEVGTSSTPGCFAGGLSPYGCTDMAGNVWEWSRSHYADYPYQANDGRENLEGIETRVVRGGSWLNLHGDARCAYRGRDLPGSRYFDFGFRVVLRSPPVR